MKMQTKLFTVYLTVGPSNCGKSYFSKNLLIPALKKATKSLNEPVQIAYLSSDEIRSQILGLETSKLDPKMGYASSGAFDILLKRLELSTSFPVNAHFVVVDSTGLSEDFRNQVKDLCAKNQYHCQALVFDYKNQEDYLEGIGEDSHQKKVTFEHLRRFRQQVLGALKKKSFEAVEVIKEKIKELEVEVLDLETYNQKLVGPGAYTFIGDIHGMLKTFKELLLKLKVEMDGDKIVSVPSHLGKLVLLGDYVDKGLDSAATVDFIYENKEHFLIVEGNHERFVVDELQRSSGLDEDFKRHYFNSIYELSTEQGQKLKELYARSHTFLKGPGFIATHAPCLIKHLGKVDKVSLKLQRKTAFEKSSKDFKTPEEYIQFHEKTLSYLKDEGNKYHPLHVFGHRTFKQVFKDKNKVGIDTGAAHGGSLTAMTLDSWGKIRFTSVKGEEIQKLTPWGLITPFEINYKEKTLEFSDFDLNRIRLLAENKICFVSGTVSPADKKEEVLESLEEGLNYYKAKTKKIVLETKHMGSRANIYLNLDLSKCKAVSRNGFLIKKDLSKVYETLLLKFSGAMKAKGWYQILLDGELMPWSALGKGLIDEVYGTISSVVLEETLALEASGFKEALEAAQGNPLKKDYDEKKHQTSKKVLQDQFKHHLPTFEAVDGFELDLTKEKEAILAYKTQLELFGKEEEVSFKPFALLKAYGDKEEVFIREDVSTEENYAFVSSEEYLVVDFEDSAYLKKAQEFFESVCAKGEEGIVIKPEFTFMKGTVPFLKVRNPEYLRLIYGYNYLEKSTYENLLGHKSVQKKRKVSAREYDLGRRLLEIPTEDISPENPLYKQLLGEFIAEEAVESTLDKRL